MAGSTEAAAAGAPDYILDIRDGGQPDPVQPPGYVTAATVQLGGGTVMVVLRHA
jgi:hypothetical protein